MLNVVCVKQGDKYGPEYVNRLYAGVRRGLMNESDGGYSGRGFKFWCITDHTNDLRPEVLPQPLNGFSYPGWWAKMLLFKPAYYIDRGRVLYLDLDTVITGNLEPLAAYEGEFCILRDFYRKNGYGSGIMAFEDGFGRHIWDAFSADPDHVMAEFYGDQEFIETQVKNADRWQDVAPGTCVSYKVHCKEGLPDGAVTVSFHGNPKPHEVNDAWVRQHWIGG